MITRSSKLGRCDPTYGKRKIGKSFCRFFDIASIYQIMRDLFKEVVVTKIIILKSRGVVHGREIGE